MPSSDASSFRSTTFVTETVQPDGALLAPEVYDVGGALGFTTHWSVLCFARLVADGLVTQVGRGRKAVLRATTRHELVQPGRGEVPEVVEPHAGHAQLLAKRPKPW